MSQRGGHDWWSIREWEGTQHRAFEELCFQLRSPAPPGWETIKTAAPDGGVEWYDQAPDGSAAHGYQVKYVTGIDELLPLARESAKTVGANIKHRKIVRLEFMAPFDLPDPTPFTPAGKRRRGARERWNDNVAAWKVELDGLAEVDIRFVGGGELLERLTLPGNEGRQWFFFDQRALGRDWCEEQIKLTERLAASRYTPAHHVALPLGRVADACALQPVFLRDAVQRARDVRSAVQALTAEARWWYQRHPAPDGSTEHAALARWVCEWADLLEEGADRLVTDMSAVTAASGFPAGPSAAVLEDMLDGFGQFHDLADRYAAVEQDGAAGSPVGSAPPAAGAGRTAAPEAAAHLRSMREGALARAERVCGQVLASMTGDAARAAETGTWLLLGEAGQGKTHLLIDAVQRAVDEGRPALAVLGQELSGHNTLEEIARRGGLGQLPARDFLQAMDAAGAAANCRFLLAIDAVNDSDDAAYWKTELRALQSAVAQYPHVALVVSCRSTLLRLVVSDAFEGPRTVHHGFAGREMEGLESYLRAIPNVLPRTPLLTSVFTNPLFVKLYADSLRRSRERGRSTTDAHPRDRSAVFEAFVDHRAEDICERLGLDASVRPVHRAVNALAAQMAADGVAVLPREQARGIADACAPAATAWPNTMLGQLIAEGIVSAERVYGTAGLGIGFPYQAFGDDRIVRSVFTAHQEEIELLRAGRALAADSPLRDWLAQAAPNLQEAATILLPEQTGTELIDLLDSAPASSGSGPAPADDEAETLHLFLTRSFLKTLALRSTHSVTERTVTLLNKAAACSHGSDYLEAVLAVTAEPGHLLNADRLHRTLVRMSRPERDAAWGIDTYNMLWDTTALHRLLRWAEQYPTPGDLHPAFRPSPRRLGAPRHAAPPVSRPADAEVARLAATALTWTLTSSNRFLRDRATKALVQLLLGHPDVLLSLLDQFLRQDADKVDDPYLFERLVWVAYGVLARRGWRPAQFLGQVARLLLEHVYGDPDSPAHASRNALLCDAATRIVAKAWEAGVITAAEASATRHPHACAEVGPAPEDEELDAHFPVRDDATPLWAPLHSSLSGLGDFAAYEVRPAVHHFSMLPLTAPYPQRPRWLRRDDPVEVDPDRIPAFAESLPDPVRPALSTPAAVAHLLNSGKGRRVLDEAQHALLRACAVPPRDDERLADAQVDSAWAARWVFAHVAKLGWSPELFAEFDTFRRRLSGSRGAHKAERIGKKYQWMALHELVERLANHQHPHRTSADDPARYPGAARLSLLDIDPTLPPARHPFTGDDEEEDVGADEAEHATFPPADASHPLAPPAPVLPADDDIDAWLRDPEGLPQLQTLGTRTDEQGREWIVLHEQAVDDHDGRGWNRTYGQAELWHRIHSWTVPAAQSGHLLAWLEGRSLMGRWMPEGLRRHSLHLADFPTAPGPWTDTDPTTWHVSTVRLPDQPTPDDADPGDDPEDAALGEEGEDGAHEDSEAEGSDLNVQAAALGLKLIDSADTDAITAWRKKQAQKKADALVLLAQQWADGPADDTDDEHVFSPRQVDIDRATGPDGENITAIPATQDYTWSAGGADCSLDAHVSVTLPSDLLLRGSGLQRHPDSPCWYDTAGQLQVQYLTCTRPTGTAQTLLASREWLKQRLRDLGHHLLQGSLGECQTVSSDHPRIWREFSQTATLPPGGPWKTSDAVTMIRRILR
ncbi:hypothetical protein [Streptomyces viridosporus]|uniref:hypothetical protein n=1 Tax=Streptomyces viridosporus TaxID=67581 RepID=UPI00332FBDD8